MDMRFSRVGLISFKPSSAVNRASEYKDKLFIAAKFIIDSGSKTRLALNSTLSMPSGKDK